MVFTEETFVVGLLSLTAALGVLFALLLFMKPKKSSLGELNNLVQLSLVQLGKKVAKVEGGISYVLHRVEASFSELNRLQAFQEAEGEALSALTSSIKELFRAQTKIAKILKTHEGKLSDLSEKHLQVERQVSAYGKKMKGVTPPLEGAGPMFREEDVSIARLTPTEMTVLKVLHLSGPKTAPEIREVIGKTREHAARLMKKLYREGYVVRNTDVMPFSYSLSERIKKSFEFSVKEEQP